MTTTLRRLVCATTVHEEQPDIPVWCARCSRWRLVLQEDLASDMRSGSPQKSIVVYCLASLVMFLSCQDPDAQPLHHDTINLPTNPAMQFPPPPVFPSLDQPNVTLILYCSRNCEINAESSWIGLANMKFRNLWETG